MARAFVCSVALSLLTFGLVLAQTGTKNLNKPNQKGTQHEAKIVNVDPQKHTVTVEMKDDNGKQVEKTFRLTEDIRMLDSEGHVAAIDVFKSGNDVLIVDEQGKLVEMRKAKEHPGK
jgi:uncharacterized protein YigE (DUF2233 family)